MSYKISIVIPCYNILNWENGEEYLNEAFSSLKNQSIGFENLEIIFVDDGSNDDTPQLLLNMSQQYENVVAVLLEHNSGSGIARFNGVQKSTSDYIMFLDADDKYSSKSCEKLYDFISKENADIVSSNYITCLNGVNYVGFDYDEEYKEFNPNSSLEKFQKQYALWARIFNKEIIKDIKLESSVLDDSYFNFKAFLDSEKVIYLNNFHSAIHNVNYESITMKPSVNSVLNAFNQIQIIIDMIKKYNKNSLADISNELFSMIMRDVLMKNFSFNDNKIILNNLRKYKEEIISNNEEIDYLLFTPFWIKIIDRLINYGLCSLVALLMRPIQLLLSNKTVFRLLFIYCFKHEVYTGEL